MTLGEYVKQYRTQHGMSMDNFAEKSGLSKGYISMLEKNENPRTKKPIVPSLETIKQVATAINIDLNTLISHLDTTPASLMGWEENNTENKSSINIEEEYFELAKELKARGLTKAQMSKLLKIYDMMNEK